jgi:hypothetical protein
MPLSAWTEKRLRKSLVCLFGKDEYKRGSGASTPKNMLETLWAKKFGCISSAENKILSRGKNGSIK